MKNTIIELLQAQGLIEKNNQDIPSQNFIDKDDSTHILIIPILEDKDTIRKNFVARVTISLIAILNAKICVSKTDSEKSVIISVSVKS